MKIKAVIGILIVLVLLISTASAQSSNQDPISGFISWIKNLIQGQSTAAITSSTTFAGWRASNYGYQTHSPPQYWINVANKISSKFPGSTPAGIWLVGETDGDGPGTILYMPSSGTYSNIRFEGADIAEPYLSAFDAAGIKVILQVEPMNGDVNTLIDIVISRYKSHPSVIGFGIDLGWYKTCTEGCKPTTENVISWNNKLHSYSSDYTLMLVHYDTDKIPTGIPTDILIVDNTEDNGNLATLVSENVLMEEEYPNNPYGAQIGSTSDMPIWSAKTDPVKDIGDAIRTGTGRPISIFWSDESIVTLFPPAIYNLVLTPTPTVTTTATPTSTATPVVTQTSIQTQLPTPTPTHTHTPTQTVQPDIQTVNSEMINPLFYLILIGIVIVVLIYNKKKNKK